MYVAHHTAWVLCLSSPIPMPAVVYCRAEDCNRGSTDPDFKYHVAFVWNVAGDFLLHTRKARLSRERNPTAALFSRC